MTYLIFQIWLALAIAALIGAAVGWWLKSVLCKTELEHESTVWKGQLEMLERERDSLKRKLSTDSTISGNAFNPPTITEQTVYPVEEVEGIGNAYGDKLRKMDITSTRELQKKCLTQEGLIEICNHLGIEDFVVSKWNSMCDLLRVPGIRGQYAELIVYSGIDSVVTLSEKKPESLHKALVATNNEQNRVKTVPEVEELQILINLAKNLKPIS